MLKQETSLISTDEIEEDLSVGTAEEVPNNNYNISSMFAAVKQKVNSEVRDDTESIEAVLGSYYAKLADNNLSFWSQYQDKNEDSKASLTLCKLAKKFLTPPPTSTTNVERLFLTASVISDGRPILLPDNLKKLLFLRQNLMMKNILLGW